MLARSKRGRWGGRRANDGIDVIFTSDLARAVETVRIAFPDPSVPALMDWRLRECDYGEMTGIDPELLEREAHIDVPYPSAESWRQVSDRVAWFLRDVKLRWRGSRLLVVGHTATWWGLEHAIKGTPLNSPFEWQPRVGIPCQVVRACS
jgi:broad specificity phosphatase PhoE